MLHERSGLNELLNKCFKFPEELVAHLVFLERLHVIGILSASEESREARSDKCGEIRMQLRQLGQFFRSVPTMVSRY